MSSPQGQLIGKASKPWTIGRHLGSGACGSVHELLPPPNYSSKSLQYAIKCVTLPPSALSTNKKRKKTMAERNADLLLHEYTILQNAGLNRGRLFPEIPLMGVGGPPAYGETADKKYRYLVMERMAAPLNDIIPTLLQMHSSTKANSSIQIPLGDVATSLFNCIHAMHLQNYLFQDVKPDNFMLAHSNTTTATNNGRGKKSNNGVANNIRLIDFGLVERYSEMASSSHREDAYPSAQLVGTPTYASLNVMGGHTPSRRDDLEALGYVICELILLLVHGDGGGGGGKKRKGKSRSSSADEDVLPWSTAKSDEELYQIKQEEMDKSKRSKSVLFGELKAAGGVDVPMGKYFNEVMKVGYAEKPDYDSLRACLSKIVVVTSGSGGKVVSSSTAKTMRGVSKKAASSSPKKPPPASTATSRPRRNPPRRKKGTTDQSSISSDENVENCKKQRVQSRTIATQTGDNDDEMICLLDDSSEEDRDDGVQDMDWEVLEDTTAGNDVAAASASRSKSANLKLEVTSGSQRGQVVLFGGDYPDVVVVGRDPGSSTAKALKDSAKLALTQDDGVSPTHAKFVIASKKNVHSVRVTNMASSSLNSETFINGTRLASGKSRQAFVGDKITLGEAILQVKRAT